MEEPFYNSSHRAFLQALLSRAVITFEDAKPLLATILTVQTETQHTADQITFDVLTQYIDALNEKLTPFAYEVRSTYPQAMLDASRSNVLERAPESAVYALVNTASDPQTAMATTYTADEMAFIRRVIDGMFGDSNNTPAREVCAIRGMEALQLAKVAASLRASVNSNAQTLQATTQAPAPGAGAVAQAPQVGQVVSISADRAEKILEELVHEGWFEQSLASYLTLGTRGLLELRQWLIDTYNEQGLESDEWERIKMCEGCKQIITIGQRCSDADCLCRLHDFCAATFFTGQQRKPCPLCQKEWTGTNFVGERAAGAPRPAQPRTGRN